MRGAYVRGANILYSDRRRSQRHADVTLHSLCTDIDARLRRRRRRCRCRRQYVLAPDVCVCVCVCRPQITNDRQQRLI